MIIVLERDRLLKKSKWLKPESYLGYLFAVICSDSEELTERVKVKMSSGDERVLLKVIRFGNCRVLKIVDRETGDCNPLQVLKVEPYGCPVTDLCTIDLLIYWK
jgi:hypothetical protein